MRIKPQDFLEAPYSCGWYMPLGVPLRVESSGSSSCPLDFHSGNIARKLGLLTRNQNDAKAVIELNTNLRLMDRNDPVKYDFALFGLGIFDHF